MKKPNLFLCFLITLTACQPNPDSSDTGAPVFKEIPTPAGEGGEPNLFVAEDGSTLLSWVEYLNDTTDALLFSQLKDGQWGPPKKVASGSNWFVNWADFPSVATFYEKPNRLAAHWLQKSAEGTYDYDVRIALSEDDGQEWKPSFIPHRDGIAAEHGFVSLLPLANGRMFAVWLDGRNTKAPEGQEEAHDHGGAMTLRTAEFDENGKLYEEAELDTRICDCCQTDAAWTDAGAVVVYRDRSEEEIRDIAMVRKVDGQWTAPQKVHADNWKIAGCPVNGPAIAAQGSTLAVAWFTAAENNSQVNIAFSGDGGASFSDPIRVDDGNPIGRVDVVFATAETALVSWIEQVEEGGEVRLAKMNAAGKIGGSITAIRTDVSRQSGFPILEKTGKEFLLAWTAGDAVTTVKTLSFEW